MAAVSTPPRYIPRGKKPPPMRLLNVMLNAQDFDFLDFGAKRLGLARAEFLRRVIHDSRLQWITKGLYEFPSEK